LYSGEAEKLLRDRIHRKNLNKTEDGAVKLSVSASDLNDFFSCPVLWLYSRIFRLEEQKLDASLLDAESLGLIYHKILQRLFERIKNNGALFLGEKLETYFEWIKEITDSTLRSNDTLRGPLVYPLLSPLASSINKKLRALLKTEARYFNNRKILELEKECKLFRGPLMLNGYIDRVSEGADPPGGDMIIDYKSGRVPPKSHCRYNEEKGLLDFQIPMYIKLYEESTGRKIGSAAFAGIRKADFVSVVGSFKKDNYSREQYQETMDELERAIGIFRNNVLALTFKREKILRSTCSSCKYKTMCRTLYSLNPVPGIGFSGEEAENDN
jgi:ATP-dependent helicase/DNAse subunit B